mmetsp:Transcript_53131/g.147861  ORF Transcript_53131/g.147861 Transcript_53131/m.147861 type:complete len:476 (+) Transcript_53131:905-2332(+)
MGFGAPKRRIEGLRRAGLTDLLRLLFLRLDRERLRLIDFFLAGDRLLRRLRLRFFGLETGDGERLLPLERLFFFRLGLRFFRLPDTERFFPPRGLRLFRLCLDRLLLRLRVFFRLPLDALLLALLFLLFFPLRLRFFRFPPNERLFRRLTLRFLRLEGERFLPLVGDLLLRLLLLRFFSFFFFAAGEPDARLGLRCFSFFFFFATGDAEASFFFATGDAEPLLLLSRFFLSLSFFTSLLFFGSGAATGAAFSVSSAFFFFCTASFAARTAGVSTAGVTASSPEPLLDSTVALGAGAGVGAFVTADSSAFAFGAAFASALRSPSLESEALSETDCTGASNTVPPFFCWSFDAFFVDFAAFSSFEDFFPTCFLSLLVFGSGVAVLLLGVFSLAFSGFSVFSALSAFLTFSTAASLSEPLALAGAFLSTFALRSLASPKLTAMRIRSSGSPFRIFMGKTMVVASKSGVSTSFVSRRAG